MANPPLTREQVLEELRFLTTVEHAVIVEDLSLHCALGHDLPAEDGGATTQQGSAARDQGLALARVRCSATKRCNWRSSKRAAIQN